MPLDASYDGYRIKYRHSDQSFVMVAPPVPSGPVTLQLSQFTGALVPSGTMVTSSWSPAANNLLFCCIGIRGNSTPAAHVTGVSGNGLTWTKILEGDDVQNAVCFQIWWAKGPSPTAGAVTLTLSTLTTNIGVHLISFSDVAPSPIGNFSTANTGATDTTPIVTSLSTSANNSKVLAFAVNRNQVVSIPGGSVFSAILVNQVLDSGGNIGRTSSYISSEIPSSGTTVTASFTPSGAADWIIGAVEIKRA